MPWHPSNTSILTLFLIIFFLDVPLLPDVLADNSPDVMLAERYDQGIDVSQYLVSEKLDGVRARWDGRKLVSRGGNVFAAPEWFTKEFPAVPLDGELWIGRGRYEEVSSIVRRKQPHNGWRNIRLMVFDLPKHGGTFEQRVRAMTRLAAQAHSPYLAVIEQYTIISEEALKQRLQAMVDQGGEGLMLHRKTARYVSGRSRNLLKLKPFTDAEATVIGYRPGKGQFAGQIGSLKVRTDQGVVLYIGSGLSHEQRRNPPPLQSRITFRYQGLTKNGIPRFPVFLRIREEEPE
jgi:DNA ligase-1